MTAGRVFIATSLDGFVARTDHRIDWLTRQATAGEDHGYEAFMAGVDGIVMGRGSFESVLAFPEWPYQKPVIVMSSRLVDSDIPSHLTSKVRLTRLDPIALMASLHEAGWQRAYIDGGSIVQSFVREGLVEELTVTLIPVLIGQGIALFGQVNADIDLDLISSKAFPSGLVRNHYRIRKN